jgi:hypothetical protein
MSFIFGDDDAMVEPGQEEDSDSSENEVVNLSEYFIISANNKVYLWWRTVYTVACLTSSYLYAFMAAFANPGKYEDIHDRVVVSFELLFLFSTALQFFVDYKEEGQI